MVVFLGVSKIKDFLVKKSLKLPIFEIKKKSLGQLMLTLTFHCDKCLQVVALVTWVLTTFNVVADCRQRRGWTWLSLHFIYKQKLKDRTPRIYTRCSKLYALSRKIQLFFQWFVVLIVFCPVKKRMIRQKKAEMLKRKISQLSIITKKQS